MNELKLADRVWHRVVQIVQEAMMTGVDCSDLLRQVRIVPDSSDPNVLTLSPDYERQVTQSFEKMLEQARELQASQTGNKFIVPGSGDDN